MLKALSVSNRFPQIDSKFACREELAGFHMGWETTTDTPLDGSAPSRQNTLPQKPFSTKSMKAEHGSVNDNSIYTLGEMGKHNVVIARLPNFKYIQH
jgi:hypothetical protein